MTTTTVVRPTLPRCAPVALDDKARRAAVALTLARIAAWERAQSPLAGNR